MIKRGFICLVQTSCKILNICGHCRPSRQNISCLINADEDGTIMIHQTDRKTFYNKGNNDDNYLNQHKRKINIICMYLVQYFLFLGFFVSFCLCSRIYYYMMAINFDTCPTSRIDGWQFLSLSPNLRISGRSVRANLNVRSKFVYAF